MSLTFSDDSNKFITSLSLFILAKNPVRSGTSNDLNPREGMLISDENQ